MTEKTVPLTREGKAKLEQELEQLRIRRREVAEMIHNAQEQGTSQNDAEYDDAKMEQGRVEGRILELEDILRRAKVIDEAAAHSADRVMVGSTVDVEQDGVVRQYRIVGGPEADPLQGKISNDSPVGTALLGRAVGDVVTVNVPKGVIRLKVLKIE
ncbi:transcription elongation factor GreA [Tepidiforma sp.]|uniref:transcription elongation factor GreA n=1 Tax=Tepidiforma sp. TaxID=2682230 RepID=UPI003A0FF76F